MKLKPTFVPTLNLLKLVSKQNSDVKVFIPKIKNAKGKLVPTVAKGKYWYVYCYFRNPKTGKMDYKFIVKSGINRFKTVKERKEYSKYLKKVLEMLINDGFNPFEKFNEPLIEDSTENFGILTVENALEKAIAIKSKQWNENTASSTKSHLNKFINYLKNNNLYTINIDELKKKHVTTFLNNLDVSNKSKNNYRASLSSIFSQLVNDDIISFNFIASIPILKVKPNKNKPFTPQQITDIRKYLNKNDPYLLKYLQFVTYAFLRPIEVNRLTVGDIDTKNARITVKTKTSKRAYILIISKLQETIKTMSIENFDSSYFLFTKDQRPNVWETLKEKQRQEWFMKRFRKVKKHFNYGNEYSIYSFRHSFTLNLYHKFLSDGMTDLEAKYKLMTITRHKSLSGLTNYLRDIGAFVPADYSNDYTIDF